MDISHISQYRMYLLKCLNHYCMLDYKLVMYVSTVKLYVFRYMFTYKYGYKRFRLIRSLDSLMYSLYNVKSDINGDFMNCWTNEVHN